MIDTQEWYTPAHLLENIIPGDNPEGLGVGERTVAIFEETVNPKNLRRSTISKGVGRKHILADRFGRQPEPGIQYVVQLTQDTQPMMPIGGAYIADTLRPTEYGQKQLEAKQEGYGDSFSIAKTDIASGKSRTRDEAIEMYKYLYPDPGDEYEYFVADCAQSFTYKADQNRYTVWRKLKEPQNQNGADGSVAIIPQASSLQQIIEARRTTPRNLVEQQEIEPVIKPIEVGERKIRILDIETEKWETKGKRIPAKEKFQYFTFDKTTLEIMYRAASAYNRRSPFFVEGDTATSKTSSIELFAHLIDADVYRINMSAQTDTSELIGKYIPNDGTMQREYEAKIHGWSAPDDETRENALSRMSPQSREIMEKAFKLHRDLTKEEAITVARNEGLEITDNMWVWKDGILTEAMTKGGIVIFDEATLSIPEVFERANSALEQPPTLVLSEKGGEVIGPGGDREVNEKYWASGTGNSPGMAGRSPFSEAMQRRLADYYIAPTPGKTEYEQMLKYMVYGTQPKVTINGIEYNWPQQDETPYALLQDVGNIDKFLEKLALFHEDMVKLTHPQTGTIGKERRKGGKYTITRQNLLSVMQFLAQEKILDVRETVKTGEPVYSKNWRKKAELALERFYVDPVLETDRKDVQAAMAKYPVAGQLLSQ